MEITKDIKYIGVNDRKTDLFEGQYLVPDGMAYNSYVILDEKIAVTDTVDASFGEEWMKNLESALDGKTPDYLIVHHMEPDHSANIAAFAEKYPNAQIVATAKAFDMMKQFFGRDYSDRKIVVKEGDTLNLGGHELQFITAPMVHWPEVALSYDKKDKVLFSADAFGKFGALDTDADWACEARRYYFGIVGKYGMQVQTLLKKAAALDIEKICPLHGPILTENLGYYIGLYNTWSSYEAETDGVVISYASAYGNTKKAAEYLAEKLKENGCTKVALNDLARCDAAEAVEDGFRYSKQVFASITYNADVFPFMRTYLDDLIERGYKNRKVAFIENGTWAPTAAKAMAKKLEGCKNLTFCETTVSIKSTMTEETKQQLDALAKELCE